MTRTHEQAGLGKPADRATQMCAVDCEYLELIACYAPHPACGVYGLAVGGHLEWIAKSSHSGLAFRKVGDVAQLYPRQVPLPLTASYRGKKKAHNRYGDHHCCECVEQDPELHEEAASGKRTVSGRGNHRLSRHFHFSMCSE